VKAYVLGATIQNMCVAPTLNGSLVRQSVREAADDVRRGLAALAT